MVRSLWAPTQANDQNPMSLGAIGRIEGWEEARPMNGPVRVNDTSMLSYLTLKRIESWDTVRTHISR